MATTQQIYDRLQQEVIGNSVSLATINRRIRHLEQDGVFLGGSAEIDRSKLGLTVYSLFVVPHEPRETSMAVLKMLLEEHPYTAYRTEIYGRKNGLYIEFNIPNTKSAEYHLLDLFNQLKQNHIVDTYTSHKIVSIPLRFNVKLSAYNVDTGEWNLEIDDFENYLHQIDDPDLDFMEEDIPMDFDFLDIILLREVQRQSRRSQTDVLALLDKAMEPSQARLDDERWMELNTKGKGGWSTREANFMKSFPPLNHWHEYQNDNLSNLPITKQTISRRLQQLEDQKFIVSYRPRINREKFGLLNQIMIVIQRDDEKISKLSKAIDKSIPFPSSIIFSEDFIFLSMNVPTVYDISILQILANYFDTIDIYFQGRQPRDYPIWHRNYIVDDHTWRDDYDWIVGSSLLLLNKDE